MVLAVKSVLDTLASLVEVDTVNDPLAGKRVTTRHGAIIAEILEPLLGKPVMLEDEGFPSLVYIRGNGRPVTLFLAHFDVVPPGPGWTRDPFRLEVEDSLAYGRGTADDKGNVAAIAHALADYQPDKGTAIIAFTGDEEIGGAHGAKYLSQWLREQGLYPDYLVNGDGAFSRVITRRRNAFNIIIRVKPQEDVVNGCSSSARFKASIAQKNTMHAAYFLPGVDSHPLIQASEFLRLRKVLASRLDGEWVKSNVIPGSVTLSYVTSGSCSTVNVDLALTKLINAIVPLTRPTIATRYYSDYGITATPNIYRFKDGTHELVIDVRAMATISDVSEYYLSLVDEALGSEAQLEVRGGGGWLYTPRSHQLVQIATQANRRLGLDPEPMEAAGASDSRFFSPAGVGAIDYGPLGQGVHGPDESVSIPHLEKAVEFYRIVASRIHG